MTKKMNYGFIITKDCLENEDIEVLGPSNITDDVVNRLRNGEGDKFRIYDGDKELYYTGRSIHNQGEEMFYPLDCYAEPNAGCVMIAYASDNYKIL
jgi:hypothetical protein